jgi:hypothetical protein
LGYFTQMADSDLILDSSTRVLLYLFHVSFIVSLYFIDIFFISSQLDSGRTLAGVLLFQSGPFMTVATLNDPSGAGFNVFNPNGGRADTVSGINPRAGQSINQWINPAAFVDPANNIGRFGDSSLGGVVGPGTQAVSMSLIKNVEVRESTRIQLGVQVANLFNHPNFAPSPNLTVGVAGFGQVTGLQTAEGAGPRAIQLTARIKF